MNERIREFDEKAQLYAERVTPQGSDHFKEKHFKEKFAELIVKDCAEFVKKELTREMQSEVLAQYVAQRIKRYYGIIGTWYYEKEYDGERKD